MEGRTVSGNSAFHSLETKAAEKLEQLETEQKQWHAEQVDEGLSVVMCQLEARAGPAEHQPAIVQQLCRHFNTCCVRDVCVLPGLFSSKTNTTTQLPDQGWLTSTNLDQCVLLLIPGQVDTAFVHFLIVFYIHPQHCALPFRCIFWVILL